MDRRTALLALAGAVSAGPAALTLSGAKAQAFVGPDQYRLMALMGGEFAIQTSRVALERATDPRVEEFAQLEIDEQTAVAASLGATPGGVSLRPDQVALLQQLQATPPGPRFDRAYVRGQIIGHNELLALNTSYAQSGVDTLGRSVATVAVPSIQTHLAILSRLGRGGQA